MAEITENLIKFGYLNENEIAKYIASEDLGKYNVCFTKDTKRIFLINGKLELIPLKSRVSIYGSVDSAIEAINNDVSCYDGEIISIKNNDAFDAYIICSYSDGTKYVKPVYEEADLDYNLLHNVPIKNVKSTVVDKVVLTDLEDGIYNINYFITPDGKSVSSIVGNFIFVETTGVNSTTIKRINSEKIVNYVIVDGVVTTETYITDKYLNEQGYAKEAYVDAKIEALKATLEEYIRDYIENTVTLLIKYLIDLELDSRYSTTKDIEELFS